MLAWNIEDVIASLNDDVILGIVAANLLSGGAGQDVLRGNAGNDELQGGDGIDILVRGLGADVLVGGAGGDRFVYEAAGDVGDTVRDFVSGSDFFEFDRAVFAEGQGSGVTVDGLVDFYAGTTPAAQDARATFLYDTDAGQLFWDADGTGSGAAAVLVATFEGAPLLTAADLHFVLVSLARGRPR